MKNQKTLYVLMILLILSLLVAQRTAIKRGQDVGNNQAAIETTQTDNSDDSAEITVSSTVQEYQHEKITQEQVVQISANAFVSFYFTNKEEDKPLLKEYTTKDLYEKIINDNETKEEQTIELVSLKTLTKNENTYKLDYLIEVKSKGEVKEIKVNLQLIEVNDKWVVSTYEVA
ncbi:hypothetical protein ACQUD0_12115 [Vagococcus fluvialis]|uniref:hypothetical protein n=1 Tax=Vagococcus fluvialis TaxID=2738 RepID=UPI003D0EA88D